MQVLSKISFTRLYLLWIFDSNPLQRGVSSMAFQPLAGYVLAVMCETGVCIWHLQYVINCIFLMLQQQQSNI